MTTAITVRALNRPAETVTAISERLSPLLPQDIPPAQFLTAAIIEANKLDDDVDCRSVGIAVFNAAAMGLMFGPMGHVYMIPYKRQVQCIPGYKGFLDLAYSAGFLIQCNAEIVLRGEKFRHWHDSGGPQIEHEIPLERNLIKPEVTAAYCTYRTKDGGHGISVVSRKELDKVDTGKNVWASEYLAMARKTPIRRAAKEWKLTRRMAWAVHLDEQADRGELQGIPEGCDLSELTVTVNHLSGDWLKEAVSRIEKTKTEAELSDMCRKLQEMHNGAGEPLLTQAQLAELDVYVERHKSKLKG